MRRNTLPHDRGIYDGDLAHARARNEPGAPAKVGCWKTRICEPRFRPSWNWSGPLSLQSRPALDKT
ncbi:hypothetical protein [Planotetraspora sp. GP83]|uniref:hypothetical protein n=1 Tax=Planotetraspora sp. GP83 TaxID=3156264 RepID=UPI003511865B